MTHELPQRIYSSRKNTDRAVTSLGGSSHMKSNEEMLVQRTSDANNHRSQELIPEAESEDDGWMMSKRRRVITNGAETGLAAPSIFLALLFVVMPLFF
ncbi:unnamed protein product [Gongylonema pulchrum]|uniref:Transmembrane protein n=1 Tax=Gongylonema pulchrum TaxID=637853 RepID=A0A183EDE2_9BILA|nr:unnamed protein product [Gongylonema pulchrum]